MHELGIMYHVVAEILKIASDNELTEVETLVLQVGELSGVVPRYLEACYLASVDGTLLENTKLEIELIPANGLCADCGKVYGLLEHKSRCPHCGGDTYETLSGGEFNIKEIVAF